MTAKPQHFPLPSIGDLAKVTWLAKNNRGETGTQICDPHPALHRPQGFDEKISKIFIPHILYPDGPGWYKRCLTFIHALVLNYQSSATASQAIHLWGVGFFKQLS